MQRSKRNTSEPQDLALAARKYGPLRRRALRLMIATYVTVLGVAILAMLCLWVLTHEAATHKVIAAILAGLGAVAASLCWVSAFAAWVALIEWRCPRCGKPFATRGMHRWPSNECKHCGLVLPRQTAA